jgi:hypothetical protein
MRGFVGGVSGCVVGPIATVSGIIGCATEEVPKGAIEAAAILGMVVLDVSEATEESIEVGKARDNMEPCRAMAFVPVPKWLLVWPGNVRSV